MNIDERIAALTQSVELMAGMHKETETEIGETQKQIKELTIEVRRFQYWAEAIILNFDSRLRALAKEPPREPPE